MICLIEDKENLESRLILEGFLKYHRKFCQHKMKPKGVKKINIKHKRRSGKFYRQNTKSDARLSTQNLCVCEVLTEEKYNSENQQEIFYQSWYKLVQVCLEEALGHHPKSSA